MLNKVRYCDPCMQWIVPAHLNSQIGGLLKRCCKYGYCLKIETLEDVIESKLFKDITTFRACLLTSFCCLLSYHIPASYLHSSSTNLLLVPRVCTTFPFRGFSVAVASVWNSLPSGIHVSSSSHRFCSIIKYQCFEQAFSSLSPFTEVSQIRRLTDCALQMILLTYIFTLRLR